MHRIAKWHAGRAGAGFTLIEVLLVVTLTTMLMYAMGEIFKLASNVVGGSEAEVETRQKARLIFSRLEMDLQSLFLSNKNNYFSIENGSIGYAGTTRQADRLRLVTTIKYNPEGLPGRMDITQATYRLEEKEKCASIMREKKYPRFEEMEDPMLIRYALTFTTQEAKDVYTSRFPDERPIQKYLVSDPPKNVREAEDVRQYIDIVSGRVLDFRVDYVLGSDLPGAKTDVETGIDTFWSHDPLRIYENSPNVEMPQAVRISIVVADTKGRLERAFESIIAVKRSFFNAQGGK